MTEETLTPDTARAARVTPLWLVLALTGLVYGLGAIWKVGCTDAYRQLCYNDIAPLYSGRGLFDGVRLYLDSWDGRFLEYPVLTGTVMQIAGWITGSGGDLQTRTTMYVAVTALLLLPLAMVTTGAMWHTEPGTRIRALGRSATDGVRQVGPRAALMVALSPILLLDGTINWDLVAVVFTALALWAWSKDAPFLTGVFLGLGTAAKLYPGLILGPLVVLCLRDRRWQALGRAVGGAALAWLVANIPLLLLSPAGFREFYSFSQTRGLDFGSVWLAIANLGGPWLPTPTINTLSMVITLGACVVVAVLAWFCRSATLAQLAFLIVAVFVLVNKVYSPQYAIWLLPLAALARPRWPAFLVWQLGEVIYFVAIWRYLLGYGQPLLPDGAVDSQTYTMAIVLHLVLTLGYAVLVVTDILRESRYSQRTTSAVVVV